MDRGWCNMHLACDLHILHTCHKKTFDAFMPEQIRGLIWLAVCWRQNHAMSVLREAIRSVVRS
eukprot:4806127-Amphidinium_carterae.1